jgi:hypothetical protein
VTTQKIKVSFDVRGFRSCVVLRKARDSLCDFKAFLLCWSATEWMEIAGGGLASLRLPWRWEANCNHPMSLSNLDDWNIP